MVFWGRLFRCCFLTRRWWDPGLVETGGGGLQDLVIGVVRGLEGSGWRASCFGCCNYMGCGGRLVILDSSLLRFVLIPDYYIEVGGGWRSRSLTLWLSSSWWLLSDGLRRRCGSDKILLL